MHILITIMIKEDAKMSSKERLRETNPEEFKRRQEKRKNAERIMLSRRLERERRTLIRAAFDGLNEYNDEIVVIALVDETQKTEKMIFSKIGVQGFSVIRLPVIRFFDLSEYFFKENAQDNGYSEEQLLLSAAKTFLGIEANKAELQDKVLLLKGARVLEEAKAYYLVADVRPNEILAMESTTRVATCGKWNVYGEKSIGKFLKLKKPLHNMLMKEDTICQICIYRYRAGKFTDEEQFDFNIRYGFCPIE